VNNLYDSKPANGIRGTAVLSQCNKAFLIRYIPENMPSPRHPKVLVRENIKLTSSHYDKNTREPVIEQHLPQS
jgi:hypothetical protein